MKTHQQLQLTRGQECALNIFFAVIVFGGWAWLLLAMCDDVIGFR